MQNSPFTLIKKPYLNKILLAFVFPKSWVSFMIFLWWLKVLAQRVAGAEGQLD